MLLICIMCWTVNVKSQLPVELSHADKILLQTGDDKFTFPGEVAAFITSNYTGEEMITRAIYGWVTSQIKYSTDSINQINLGTNSNAKITEAFRRRRGVCENYAAIFNDLCARSKITSYIIDGYTKQSGEVDKIGHTWCAVRINGIWGLCDPTWDNGVDMNSKYYLVNPGEFIQTHMPYDPIWQLLRNPISHREFYSGHSNNGSESWNYPDSIEKFLSLDTLTRMQAALSRIQKEGSENALITNWKNKLLMYKEIMFQDRDTLTYKLAVADLNAAVSIYNDFINYRNGGFTPAKSDSQILYSLQTAKEKLVALIKRTDELDSSKANLTINTDGIRFRSRALLFKIEQQEDFVLLYLNTTPARRRALFYK